MQKPFTLVIPSRSPQKLQLTSQLWGRGLSDLGTNDHPLIPLIGASNIAMGYNAALQKVETEYCIFSHDDAWPLSYPRYFMGQRLLERMREVDVLGFCGSDKFTGSSWQSSGSLYGIVLNHPPLPDPIDPPNLAALQSGMRPGSVAMWLRPARLIRGIKVGDGYCIVARTEALKKLGGFRVPESCPYFHFYDLDLFLRAHEAGLRTAIAADIYVSHNSAGSYNQPEWAGGVSEFFSWWKGKADPGLGIAAVHGTIHCNDARIALLAVQEDEKYMKDVITLGEISQ
jgi:hypothetical protein